MRSLALVTVLLAASPLIAGPKVGIVVGPDAPKLERFAADEIAVQFKQLFQAEAAIADKAPAGVDHLILVGSPATNPAVKEAMGDRWPKLGDQGHLVRSAKLGNRLVIVVGGSSPTATLWAAYELGHHFGIRSFLHGDVMPEKVPELTLDGIDITLEPAVKVRAWRILEASPTASNGWGLDDHKLLFRQLAKFKFTHVVPGIDLKKPEALKHWRRIAVSGDTPGRKAFKGAKEFGNPALAGRSTEAERKAALANFAEELKRSAEECGLKYGTPTGLSITLNFERSLPRITPASGGGIGFRVYADVPGDINPTLYYLSRRAFEPALTAKDAYSRYFTPILGPTATERVLLGLELIDRAITLSEGQDPGFSTFEPGGVAGQAKVSELPPEWWQKAGKLYGEAMNEMYRGIRATFNDPARPVLLYYAKRCEFAVYYFAALEAARLAGVAKSKGEKDAVVTHIEKAIESVYNGLTALGDVARDPSDRGVIAVLAEETYRPLKAALKEADKAARGE